MSAELAKAARVRMPHDFNRTANDFGGRKFAVTTASQTASLNWLQYSGRFVFFYIPTGGAEVHVAVTKNLAAGAEVDTAEAATAAGAVDGVGLPIPVEQIVHLQMPVWEKNENALLVFEGAGATTMYMFLGDGA